MQQISMKICQLIFRGLLIFCFCQCIILKRYLDVTISEYSTPKLEKTIIKNNKTLTETKLFLLLQYN